MSKIKHTRIGQKDRVNIVEKLKEYRVKNYINNIICNDFEIVLPENNNVK